MARPVRRTKKAVDYSQFGDTDDDDEDFASVGAPSNKKSKKVRSEPMKGNTGQQKQAHKEGSQLQKMSPIKRVPLDDKLYQRDLEVALALSVNESSGSSCKIQDLEEQALDDSANSYATTGENSDQQVGAVCQQQSQTEDKVNGTNNHELSNSVEESESNSSFSEDDDDEFVVKKKTKEKRKEGRKINVRNERKIKKPSKSTRNLNESQPALQNSFISSEPIGKPLKTSSPSTTKKPQWTPPGNSGSNSDQQRSVPVKSPTQGLRLGLSRLAKVKPLHQSFVKS